MHLSFIVMLFDCFKQFFGVDNVAVDVVEDLQLVVLDLLGGSHAGIFNEPDLKAFVSKGFCGSVAFKESVDFLFVCFAFAAKIMGVHMVGDDDTVVAE